MRLAGAAGLLLLATTVLGCGDVGIVDQKDFSESSGSILSRFRRQAASLVDRKACGDGQKEPKTR